MHSCSKCERGFNRIRLAAYWPTAIPCKYCKTKHAFRYGHLIGIAFLLVMLPAIFAPAIIAPYFGRVEGNIHIAGPMQKAVYFGSLFAIVSLLLFVQGTLLTRFGRFRARGDAGNGA